MLLTLGTLALVGGWVYVYVAETGAAAAAPAAVAGKSVTDKTGVCSTSNRRPSQTVSAPAERGRGRVRVC